MKLFGYNSRTAPHSNAAVPAGSRIYAIGDIHGRADLLQALHDKIVDDARHAAAARKCIVYLGDYVDRGLQSKLVIELLLNGAPEGFEVAYLKGNHEDFMLRFLEDSRIGPAWIANGGGETLYSYGVRSFERGEELDLLNHLRMQLRERLPERHLQFLRALKLWHVEGDYFFVHAGIRPGIALEEQRAEDMLWIRELFLNDERDHGKIIVHGHTIADEPQARSNRIGIDTGAYATGVLTCLVLEGTARGFIQTSG